MKALAFSGGKDSMACLHLLRDELDCAIYVDTAYSYPETRALVEYAAKLVPMHVVRSTREDDAIPADVVPMDWTATGQSMTGKKSCTVQSYFDCCFKNIALPLIEKAKELGVTELVYGQRNDESRKATSRDGNVVMGMVRRHPIEDWREQDVLEYLATKMDVPEHYEIKHSSLDCYDCTAYVQDSRDRIEWMREKHPIFFAHYRTRAARLDGALKEAMHGG